MEKKNKIYHVKIYNKFLIDLKGIFTSEYSRWVYIYLKLINNVKIQHKKENYYPINVPEIAAFFKIDRATVFDCLRDLGKFQLLSKEGRNNYRLESEDALLKLYYEARELDECLEDQKFVPVHKNFFIDFFDSGCGIREAEVYYYLINQNKHYTINKPLLEINVKNNKICEDLKMDHRTLKKIINNLLEARLLMNDEKNKLLTISPKPIREYSQSKENTECTMEIYQPMPQKQEEIKNEDNKNFLGWYKSRDGQRETEMLKHHIHKVILGGSRPADGIPPTTEQIERQTRIRTTGVVEERLDIFA